MVKFKEAIQTRNALVKYRDEKYLNMINQLNTQSQDIIKDNMGSQFVISCGRDLAGEIVRNFFDTSDYFITVDQLAERLLNFTYENDIDPLRDNNKVHKNVYQYNDLNSERLDRITTQIDESQTKLFLKAPNAQGKMKYVDTKIIDEGKDKYIEGKKQNGPLVDDYTGEEGDYITDKNGRRMRRLQIEHTQSLASATYNERYIKEQGVEALKKMYNSEDNFSLMIDTANQAKSDVRVYMDSEGNVIPRKGAPPEGSGLTDITHRATPEQYADAVISTWLNVEKEETRQKLIDKGYLNPDGTVPKHIRKKLIKNFRRSQNAESIVILKNADYLVVGKDSAKETAKSLGKIVAGQIIYYVAPPLIYEMRLILKKKPSSLEDVLDSLKTAGGNIVEYVLSNLKQMFANIGMNSLKNFIKIFMDILINLVKATIRKIVRLAKNLVLATVDAVRILARKDSSVAEKADAVANLFGTTITTFAVDVLFDTLSVGMYIPDFLLMPLQILTTVVCTNLTMIMLQKADLFDVRFGYKINQIRNLFENAADEFNDEMQLAESYSANKMNEIIKLAEEECNQIYDNLVELNPYETEVRSDLEKLNVLFDMGIQFRAV